LLALSQPEIYNGKELLLQIAAGDQAAFEQFYNIHWRKIHSMALAYLKSPEQAQDIVQEVFLKLWAKRERLANVENPDAFIFIMGRNEVVNALKKKVNLHMIGEHTTDDLPDDLLLPHQVMDIKQLEKKIGDAIEALPDRQKQIFKLSREEGLNHEQIAQRLGIERSTVKNHIVRALFTLRQHLGLTGNSLLFWYLLAEWFGNN
jgi:RNA polymerase sigma-70 factor (family 1)